MSHTFSDTWRVSLHGGHTGEFCAHASGTLKERLQQAIDAGYHTFGVSEHVSRPQSYLYRDEISRGWDADKLEERFAAYTTALPPLTDEFASELIILRGFEAEVVPISGYKEKMLFLRDSQLPSGKPAFDYFVGSVHYVNGIEIDGSLELFHDLIEESRGLEKFIVRYFQTVTEMVEALKPDVVGHIDLPRKNLLKAGLGTDMPETRETLAAERETLEAIRAAGAILDLNLAALRKGLPTPYPAPGLVKRAHAMGVPFCFGDDSHRPGEVGQGLETGRQYLLDLGVNQIGIITKENGEVVRKSVSLL